MHLTKYHLFMGENYYPEGGMHDHKGSFNTLEDAVAKVESSYKSVVLGYWWHIYATTMTGELELVEFK